MNDLIIIGDSSFAEIASLYFDRDSDFNVRAFVVDDAFKTRTSLNGKPIIAKSEALKEFNPKQTFFYAAIVYSQLNRLRTKFFNEFISLGFSPASYISQNAYVDSTSIIGSHVFIFEHNVIQPFTKIADNVVLWSGNHIGHHSTIQANCFISSQVVISGHCDIGENSFIGVNAAIGNNVSIGSDNWIMPGTNLLKSTSSNQLWRPEKPILGSVSPERLFLQKND